LTFSGYAGIRERRKNFIASCKTFDTLPANGETPTLSCGRAPFGPVHLQSARIPPVHRRLSASLFAMGESGHAKTGAIENFSGPI
jgi:hypothetical protein